MIRLRDLVSEAREVVHQPLSAPLDAQADLARIDHQRVRPERMVADRQISAGALHSGYPIMGHLNHGGDAVDLATLEQRGSWGIFHELGHNHQNRDWELRGTTEATVNLWSVYTMEHVVGLPARSGHSAITATRRAQRIDQYIAQGRNYASDWRVWTALETYLQLQEGFGWPFMFAVIDQYNGLTQSQRPGDEAARIEQWITRTSSVAGVDLVPFYEAWGWPVSNAARAATAGLPAWAGDPMRGR